MTSKLLKQISIDQQWTLNHLGYAVNDMDEALETWCSIGSEIMIESKPDEVQGVTCALLNFQGTPIELVAPICDRGSHPLTSRLSSGGGLDHICYNAQDFSFNRIIKSARIGRPISKIEYAPVFNRYIQFFLLRTGLIVEIMSDNPQ